MSESLGKAVLELAADHAPLARGMDQAERSVTSKTQSMGSKMKAGLQRAMLPAIGVLAAVGAGAKKTIDAASDLSEQINKTGVVFGSAAKDVHAWSRTTASSIGISQRAALEAAGVFGNMLVPMGFARGKAAEMSKGLVELSADLASFNNADPTEVMDALRAGLSGETEPLRRFGVFLNQARIEQEALNKHLWNGKGQMDAHAKAAATMSIILKDTKDAQGDFANTSTSAANAERIQAAQAEDLSAKIGKGLLPVYQQLQQLLLKVTGFLSKHTGAVKIAVTVIAGLAVAVIAVNAGMKLYAAGAAVVTAAQWLWNASLMGFPLLWIVAAIAAVVAVIVLAVKHWDTIKRVVLAAWAAIKAATVSAANAVVGAISAAWSWVKGATVAVWNAIKSAIRSVLGAIKSAVVTYFNTYRTVISGAWNAIKSATTAVWNAIKSFISGAWRSIKNAIGDALSAAVTAVRNGWNRAKEVTTNLVGSIVNYVKDTPARFVRNLSSLARLLAGVARDAWNAFDDAVDKGVSKVLGLVKNVPGRIVNALGSVRRLLFDAGASIIQGLIDGLTAKLGEVYSLVSKIAGKIKGLKGPLPKDRVLLVEEGQAIIEGLEHGMTSRLSGLLARVSGIAPSISQTVAQSVPSGTSSAERTGPLVNIEHMEVSDRFDESRFASDIGWKVQIA